MPSRLKPEAPQDVPQDLPPEVRKYFSMLGKRGAPIVNAALTPEQRQERGRIASTVRWARVRRRLVEAGGLPKVDEE